MFRFRGRVFSGMVACAILLSVNQSILSSTVCNNTRQGRICVSQVDFAKFEQRTYQRQQKSEWCWAACISMLFGYYSHPVSQARIVSEAFGAPYDLPSGSGARIAQDINRPWRDDNGRLFTSRLTAAYDFDARVLAVDNNFLINELDKDRPFIIAAGTHAVVGTAFQYRITPQGPQVLRVGVFDPWPGRGARGLTPVEMLPMHMGGALRFIGTTTVN